MKEIERLNIAFLKTVPNQNGLDRLIAGLAKIDGNKEDLTLEEVREAYDSGDPLFYAFEKYKMSPEIFFRDIRAYLTVRWFRQEKCGVKESVESCADPIWTYLALTNYYRPGYVRELASLRAYVNTEANHPERISDFIGRRLLTPKEQLVLKPAFNTIAHLSLEDVNRLLVHHDKIKKGTKEETEGNSDPIHREKIIIELADRYSHEGDKSTENANLLLNIIKTKARSGFDVLVSELLKLKRKMDEIKNPDYSKHIKNVIKAAKDRGPDIEDQPFEFPKPAETFGGYIASLLPIVSIADEKVVEEMLKDIREGAHDDATKEYIVSAFRTIEFSGEKAKKKAAIGLYEYLMEKTINSNGNETVERHLIECIRAYTVLGFTRLGERDIFAPLGKFALMAGQSDIQVVAVRAIGVLGIKDTMPRELKKKALVLLTDAAGDPESREVADQAALWHDRIIDKLYKIH